MLMTLQAPHREKLEIGRLRISPICCFLPYSVVSGEENQREHMVKHQREKKFIRSLISDLSADTSRLGTIINLRNERAVMLDSFRYL